MTYLADVEINKNAKIMLMPFTDYFQGFEKVAAVKELFGNETEVVLGNLKVEFYSMRGYMSVSSEDGHLRISAHYLKNGDGQDIYLDIIHELVHVKQFREGLELRDRRFTYFNRPTEIEAFSHTVKEARRIGMIDTQIYLYLKTERMSEENVRKLAQMLKVNYDHPIYPRENS